MNGSMISIGGLQPVSCIEFPGKVSCVLFLNGCNFKCPYCHNPELAGFNCNFRAPYSVSRFYSFLKERRSFLDGVVISGGEPTLCNDLPELCRSIKQMGYSVKLDTNGSRPEMVGQLLQEQLVDYVAMDIKTDPLQYTPIFHRDELPLNILVSIDLIMRCAPDYEFRTTCVKPLINETILKYIGRLIEGAKRYFLQRFNPAQVLSPQFFGDDDPAFSDAELETLRSVAQGYVNHCAVR